jgi:hypothetical protein
LDQTNKLIDDFIESTDSALTIEKELNEFALECVKPLIVNGTTLHAYRDAVYSINLVNQHPHYIIRVGNVTEYRNTMNTPYEDQMRILRGDFDFDPEYSLEEQVKAALTAMMFRIYGLVQKPNIQDEGTVKI